LGETSKYSVFLEELNSLEKQVYAYVQKNSELTLEIEEIKKELESLQKENEVLKLKNEELEEKIEKGAGVFPENMNSDEREALKLKLDSLINKIDYHIRS